MCDLARRPPPAIRTPETGDPKRLVSPERWQERFLRPAPIVCDLGAGNGLFAAAYAELHPEWNVLAVERKLHRVRQIERASTLRCLTNLRVLWFSWDDLLLSWSRRSSCREIHVLFPDPWPKRRHQSRRTLTAAVVASILRVLEPGGLFRFLTDDADYSRAVERTAAALPGFARREASGDYPASHFESIFRSKGDLLYGAVWRKEETPGEGETR